MSDCEPLEFYSETMHHARKQHKCCECCKPIEVGEIYMNCRMKYDRTLFVEKQHMRCFHFARHVNYNLGWRESYACVPFGGIGEAVGDYNDSDVQELWDQVRDGFEFTAPFGSKTWHMPIGS